MKSNVTKPTNRTILSGLPHKIEHATSRREYYVIDTDTAQNTIRLQPVEGGYPVPFVLSRVWNGATLMREWRECK